MIRRFNVVVELRVEADPALIDDAQKAAVAGLHVAFAGIGWDEKATVKIESVGWGEKKREADWAGLYKIVNRVTGVTMKQIKRSKGHRVKSSRNMLCLLAHDLLGMTNLLLSCKLGTCESTIRDGIRSFQDRLADNPGRTAIQHEPKTEIKRWSDQYYAERCAEARRWYLMAMQKWKEIQGDSDASR